MSKIVRKISRLEAINKQLLEACEAALSKMTVSDDPNWVADGCLSVVLELREAIAKAKE